MRRGSFFWGAIIIMLGLVLLVGNLFPGLNVWAVFWPLILILMGLWFLLGPVMYRGNYKSEAISVPLGDADEAVVRLHHGAGQLNVKGEGAPGELLAGTLAGESDLNVRKEGKRAIVNLSARHAVAWFGWWGYYPQGITWDLVLTPEVPLQLFLETGASETNLDLTNLKVTDLSLKTGASSSSIILPGRAGFTRVKVESGAAAVKIYLPQGVAGRIHVNSALAGINIDQNRFPKNFNSYETPGYETAENKAEISIETGVGGIEIV